MGGFGFAHGAQKKKVEKVLLQDRRSTMKALTRATLGVCVAIAISVVLCAGPAQAKEVTWDEPNWPDIFEPNWPRFGGPVNEPMTLYLDMDPCDWQAVISNSPGPTPPDCILTEVELPAWFWMKGEDSNKIRVAVRRKKGFAFPDEVDPCKVALKIDINQYYCDPCSEDCNSDPLYDPNAAPDWHGLKKLSLEINIDSIDAIAEGVAINLHRMASLAEGYSNALWYSNWVKLYVNGNYIGIYANAEQRDKQWMKNHDYYVSHDSWLYKYADCEPGFVLRTGDDDFPKSPAVEALCYQPFVNTGDDPNLMPSGGECSIPNDVNIVADMNEYVNMKRMLTSQAAAAFLANSDSLFSSGNNTYFLDWNLDDPCESRKRMYLEWDVDSSFKSTSEDIYYTSSSDIYDTVILGNPVFRSQYNQIMRDLLDGPFQFEDINDFLDMVEPVISDAVEADTWAMSHLSSRLGASSAAEAFDWLRDWFKDRIPDVRNQVDWDEPLMPDGTVLLNDDFNNAVWDANWVGGHMWQADTGTYAHDIPAAYATKDNGGNFECNDLDANGATAIHIDFWYQKDDTEEAGDALLYYYDGSSYNLIADLDTLGEDDKWLHYTDTITDSNYFIPNFRLRFTGTSERNEALWVDEVVVTKEEPPPAQTISGTILDPGSAAVAGVSVDANNGGGSDSTDVNGLYELQVPYDWSGTATPSKTDYTFNPGSKSYSNVITAQTTQDYTGTSIYDLNPDGVVIDWKDIKVLCDNWLTAGPSGDLNDDNYVDITDLALEASVW
jgi:hypothetical protein